MSAFVQASAQAAGDFQHLLGLKQASFGLCCFGNPALAHVQAAEDLTSKASHQFARAAAITTDLNVKSAVRAAEQRAIDAFAMAKEAEVKLISDVARN